MLNGTTKPTVIFVGNGHMDKDLSAEINAADFVIRSQHCANYKGKAGLKTDVLCIRPCNEPFGQEVAFDKRIPNDAANDCRYLIMCNRKDNPHTRLLLNNYPQLRCKPILTISESSARELLLQYGGKTLRQDGQLNPTMGMCILHFAVDKQLYNFYDIKCVGFSWGYGNHSDHDSSVERQIQEEWHSKQYIGFI